MPENEPCRPPDYDDRGDLCPPSNRCERLLMAILQKLGQFTEIVETRLDMKIHLEEQLATHP